MFAIDFLANLPNFLSGISMLEWLGCVFLAFLVLCGLLMASVLLFRDEKDDKPKMRDVFCAAAIFSVLLVVSLAVFFCGFYLVAGIGGIIAAIISGASAENCLRFGIFLSLFVWFICPFLLARLMAWLDNASLSRRFSS